ncbi:MAG: hypothetical protein ACOC6U_01840 [Thermoplasmatota archaeon]
MQMQVSAQVKEGDLTYDAVIQSWKGDSGDAWYDEDDGNIKFAVYTDAELSPSEQKELAETYSPVLYFHKDKEYFPVDMGTCLNLHWSKTVRIFTAQLPMIWPNIRVAAIISIFGVILKIYTIPQCTPEYLPQPTTK